MLWISNPFTERKTTKLKGAARATAHSSQRPREAQVSSFSEVSILERNVGLEREEIHARRPAIANKNIMQATYENLNFLVVTFKKYINSVKSSLTTYNI